MTDKQIQEELNSFALHLKDPDVIGDFKRLREIVTNEITERQAGMEEIGEQKPYNRYGMVINCPTCEIMIRSAHGFTRGE